MTGTTKTFTVNTNVVDAWQMVSVSRISDQLNVYVNGVVSTTGAQTISNAFNMEFFGYTSFQFLGQMDEAHILIGTGMTATNVTDTYNSGAGKSFVTVMGSATHHWNFDQSGTDMTLTDSIGVVDGTLTNFTTGMWLDHDTLL